MSITRELLNLQEIDQNLAAEEQRRAELLEQLKGNPEITTTRKHLEAAEKKKAELTRDQRKLETEIDDISAKLKKYEDELYSGRSSNTKELTGLQQEIELLKNNRSELEDRELELMESDEKIDTIIEKFTRHLEKLEAAWQTEEKRLKTELSVTELDLAGIQERRDTATSAFDPTVLKMYEELKKQRGTAVARVTRSICQGCRIQLPVGELQQIRSGQIVRCSSCGRILLSDQ